MCKIKTPMEPLQNNAAQWYSTLIKPSFAPPSYLFGIVWSILYPIIFLSFGYVFFLAWKKEIPRRTTIPFIANLICNFSFSPIQFGLQINWLAAIDILLVLATIIWCIIAIKKYSKPVAIAQIPYLLWVAFATVLQLSITYLNF